MVLAILAVLSFFLAVLLPVVEVWQEHDWPRSTLKASVCLTAIGLLCLFVL